MHILRETLLTMACSKLRLLCKKNHDQKFKFSFFTPLGFSQAVLIIGQVNGVTKGDDFFYVTNVITNKSKDIFSSLLTIMVVSLKSL